MNKHIVLKELKECGVIAVIRAESADIAIKIAEACRQGGIRGIEITFTVPGAVDVIRALSDRYEPEEMLIGAGTVLDPETARAAILAGAKFIVTPSLNVETVKLCLRYQIVCMAGATSLKEVIDVLEAGSDIVKIFPGNLFGPAIIKSYLGPLPYAPMMPTGGVSVENAAEWIEAGAVAVGIGGELTASAKLGDYEMVTSKAIEIVRNVKVARTKKLK